MCIPSSALSSWVQRCLFRGFMSKGINPRTCRISAVSACFSRLVRSRTVLMKASDPTPIRLMRDISALSRCATPAEAPFQPLEPRGDGTPDAPGSDCARHQAQNAAPPKRDQPGDHRGHEHWMRAEKMRCRRGAIGHWDRALEILERGGDGVPLRLSASDQSLLAASQLDGVVHGTCLRESVAILPEFIECGRKQLRPGLRGVPRAHGENDAYPERR